MPILMCYTNKDTVDLCRNLTPCHRINRNLHENKRSHKWICVECITVYRAGKTPCARNKWCGKTGGLSRQVFSTKIQIFSTFWSTYPLVMVPAMIDSVFLYMWSLHVCTQSNLTHPEKPRFLMLKIATSQKQDEDLYDRPSITSTQLLHNAVLCRRLLTVYYMWMTIDSLSWSALYFWRDLRKYNFGISWLKHSKKLSLWT